MTKIEFIRASFPELQSIDPRSDIRFVYKVKAYLIKYGYYTKDTDMLTDTVTNLLLKAKGEFKNRTATNRKERKLYESKG